MVRWFRRPWFQFFRPRKRYAGRYVTSPPAESRIPTEATPRLIQDLAVIVIHDVEALEGGVEDPPGLTLDDPSSPGPESSWGSGTIATDPITDEPITGETENSRNPGGPDAGGAVAPRKRRKGGSGRQPNKNSLTLVTAGAPHHCFQGEIIIEITNPPPDIGGWTGQQPPFVGVLCTGYNPPVLNGPTTALVVRMNVADPIVGTPVGMPLVTYIARWLAHYVGSACTSVVISDLLGTASAVPCTAQPCGGAPVPSVPGTGNGTIIGPG